MPSSATNCQVSDSQAPKLPGDAHGKPCFITAADKQDVKILDAYAAYFASKKNANVGRASILKLCFLVYTFETQLRPDAVEAWQLMFRNVAHLLKKSSKQDHTTDQDTGQVGETAYSILDTIHHETIKGQRWYRNVARRGVEDATEGDEEMDDYLRWNKHFDVSASAVPDEIVDLLRKVASSTTDEDGHTFWRVRRLEDMKKMLGRPADFSEGSGNTVRTEVPLAMPEAQLIVPMPSPTYHFLLTEAASQHPRSRTDVEHPSSLHGTVGISQAAGGRQRAGGGGNDSTVERESWHGMTLMDR